MANGGVANPIWCAYYKLSRQLRIAALRIATTTAATTTAATKSKPKRMDLFSAADVAQVVRSRQF